MMEAKTLLLLSVLHMVSFSGALTGDDDELDPFDMVNFDSANMKMKKIVSTQLQGNPKEPTKVDEASSRKPDTQKGPSERNRETGESLTTEKSADQEKGNKNILKTESRESSTRTDPLKQHSEDSRGGRGGECPKVDGQCPALSLFQQFVTVLLRFVEDKVLLTDEKRKATDMCVHLSLNRLELETLESFKRDPSKGREFAAHDVLCHAIRGARALEEDDPLLRSMWLEEHFGISVEKALQLGLFAVVVVVLALLMSKLRLSWNLAVWIFVLSFVVSVVMTWYRLYKGEVAKQHEAMMKDLPADCKELPNGGSPLQNMVNLYKYYFTFQKDACVTYYEHLLVDPIVKVSPMEALAVAIVQTLLKPLRIVGMEFSEFMRALLKDLPVQWQIFSVISVFGFFVLLLFLTCGYRLRVPFLLAIEPAHRPHRIKGEDVAALEQTIRELKEQVEIIGAAHNVPLPPPPLPVMAPQLPRLPPYPMDEEYDQSFGEPSYSSTGAHSSNRAPTGGSRNQREVRQSDTSHSAPPQNRHNNASRRLGNNETGASVLGFSAESSTDGPVSQSNGQKRDGGQVNGQGREFDQGREANIRGQERDIRQETRNDDVNETDNNERGWDILNDIDDETDVPLPSGVPCEEDIQQVEHR